MHDLVLYTNNDGQVVETWVNIAGGWTAPHIIVKDCTDAQDTPFSVISSQMYFPHNLLRGSWKLVNNQITLDMPTARDIHRNLVRRARKPLLEAQDVLWFKAQEAGDTAAQATIATTKQDLRDAPANPAIAAAPTENDLIAAWDATLLGPSPY